MGYLVRGIPVTLIHADDEHIRFQRIGHLGHPWARELTVDWLGQLPDGFLERFLRHVLGYCFNGCWIPAFAGMTIDLAMVARSGRESLRDRQDGFGAVGGEFDLEGVEEEGGLGVVAHKRGDLDEVLRAELLQGNLEG